MKIIFTGATSFTGLWFVKELAQKGFEVISLIKRKRSDYSGLRLDRLLEVEKWSTPVFGCDFGSDLFFQVLNELTTLDIFCHHAADVTDYKSVIFNPVQGRR